MNNVSLERLVSFNKELATLSAAGLPLEIGEKGESVDAVLERVDANLALRTKLGQSVPEALADDDALPPVYRSAVRSGLLNESPSAVLDGICGRSMAQHELRRTFGYSFVQPLIHFTLAYFGFIFLCVFFSPSLESIYDQLRRPPSATLSLLRTARIWMPLWASLVPVLLIAGVLLWKYSVDWIPLTGRYLETLKHANLAGQVAALLEHGVSLAEALRLASGMTDDRGLIEASETAALTVERGESASAADQRLQALPPLLRWALTEKLDDQSLPEILRFAESFYRQSAQRRAALFGIAFPVLIGAVLGGAIALAYCLCVFGPYVQMLQDLV